MIIDDMDRILEYIYNRVPDRHPTFQISRDVFSNDYKVPLSEMLMHLMDDGYIYKWIFSPEDTIPQEMREQFGLSVKGILFFDNARIQNRPYYSSKIDSETQKAIEDKIQTNTLRNSTSELWVKKYWWVVMIIAWALGFFADLGKEYFKQKIQQNEKAK
jgi:hypothetical protein